MSSRSASWFASIAAVGMVLVAACSSTAAGASAPGGSGGPAMSPTASMPDLASRPAAVATPVPDASLASPATEPPAASLETDGGDPVNGQLGSYTWSGGGSDSPWLQGSPIRVGSGEPLTVTLAGGPAIGDWTVQRVAGGTTGGSGAVAMGSGEGTPIAFIAPGPGSWSILVNVRFANASDAAAYYWLLDVR